MECICSVPEMGTNLYCPVCYTEIEVYQNEYNEMMAAPACRCMRCTCPVMKGEGTTCELERKFSSNPMK
jgi:hypothetical protein